MRFEWDPEKARDNSRKHKVTFREALTVFFDPLAATFRDPDHSDHEERCLTIGYSATGRLLVVCHTDRVRAVRLLGARSATVSERKRHEG